MVSAFNVHNYARNTVKTNFTLQSRYGENCIVVSFDKGMGRYQCRRYLDSIQRKIVGEFYGIEEGDTDEVVSNTANLIFNIKSFPFNISKGKWSQDEQGRIEFLAPIDKGVIFNLKSHLASSLKKDILEDMPTCSIVTNSFNKEKYLCHSKFPNKESRKKFESEFLSRMRERYENVPKKLLEVKGNSVYIKDVFDDARFIDSVTRYKAWLVGMYLGVDSSANHKVKLFKDMIIESIGQSTGVTIYGFVCASPLGKEEASILIPLVLDGEEKRILTNEEALELNCTFNCAVFYDLYGRTQGKLSINESSGMYSINFSNPYISHCVITKIIESSVINKDHELSIDPELRFQALSPAQSPFNSPMHAGPSGIRTPPNQRRSIDSGIGESPPKPKDSGSSSGGPGPSTELSDIEWESPTRSQDEALKDSPRRESEQGSETEKEGRPLHNHVNSAGTSKGFPPLPQLNSIAVSYGVSGPSKGGNLGAAAASGSIPGSSLRLQSEPSSSKDANKGMSTWTSQPMNHWSSPASSAGFSLWSQSEPSSSRGAGKNMLTGSSSWSLPPSTSFLTTRNDSISSNLGIFADPPEDTENICSMKPEKQQVTDESDRESSDECSEAKSQESESPKKHGGGPLCSNSSTGSMWSKLKGNVLPSLRRNNRERSSVCSISSSVSAPVTPVTEELPLSTRSPSLPIEIVKSRSLKVTPVTEVHTENKPTELNDSITELPSQGTVGKLNMPGDRSSKISVDSGLGSLERGQSPPLTEEFSDSSQQDLSIGVKLGNMLSELLNSAQNLLKNPASSTHRGVPGGPKRQASLTSSQRQELRKVLSPEMRKKLDANFFPPGYEKLLHILYVDSEGLCSLLSSPEAKEQVCSVLPPEEKEQVQSGSPEEIVRLLHKFFSNQKISDNCLLSSKIDFPKIKKLLQEEIFV
ncbi:hypothetical protein [Wolbachia endosymbiont (group B) of Ennomos erosarius]|uniref:hypothetical protein n=1 Tax=Wolbachia endosymbiont (group B) of Ennomos erosarius TaxID=3066175 RepID=UPI0031335373